MKILVTGATGLLGEAVCRIAGEKHQVVALKGRDDGDITKTEEIIRKIAGAKPEVVVHTAAIKDPDIAEKDPKGAHLVNCIGTRNVALAAKRVGAKMLYVSTECVYDGEKRTPYFEYDKTNPTSVYGQTKLMGEDITISLLDKHFIVRLPVLFGVGGKPEENMIYKLVSKIKRGEAVSAPSDQYSQPTFVDLVAEVVVKLVDTDYFGIYNVSCSGAASRYDLNKAVLEALGLDASRLLPVADAQMHRPVVRTRYVTMDNLALESTLGVKLPSWREGIEMCTKKMQGLKR